MGELMLREWSSDGDLQQAWRLGNLVFGRDLDTAFVAPRPGDDMLRLGFFEGDAMVAKLQVASYEQCFGGAAVAMGGICGVGVAPEQRGRALAQRMLDAALPMMRDRGQVISTLFPAAVGLYRSRGWELAGVLPTITLATSELMRTPTRGDASMRQATTEDEPAIRDLYLRHALAGNGMLTRTGPRFDGLSVLDLDRVAVAERGGDMVGFVSYDRRYVDEVQRMQLSVYDLIASDAGAIDAILHQLAGWESMSRTTTIRCLDRDAVALRYRGTMPAAHREQPWMLRVVDVEGAMSARGWNPHVTVQVDLEITDAQVDSNAGAWRLEVAQGAATLTRGGRGEVELDIRALSALYAGGTDVETLRRGGILVGDRRAASALDAAFAGPQPVLLDFF